MLTNLPHFPSVIITQESCGHSGVHYADGITAVMPGDFVEMRVWAKLFKKEKASVVYVPGISKIHRDMEFGGLMWVGIKFKDGTVVGVLVNPETRRLKKAIKFLQRGILEQPLLETPIEY